MKKKLLILALLLYSTIGYSQRISLKNLLDIQNASIVDAEDIAMRLKFQHFNSTDKVAGFDESFHFSKNNESSNAFMTITKNVHKNRNTNTMFCTVYESDYIALKKTIINQGYKFARTIKDDEGGLIHYYGKGNDGVNLSVSANKNNIPFYVIMVTNIENEMLYYNEMLYHNNEK